MKNILFKSLFVILSIFLAITSKQFYLHSSNNIQEEIKLLKKVYANKETKQILYPLKKKYKMKNIADEYGKISSEFVQNRVLLISAIGKIFFGNKRAYLCTINMYQGCKIIKNKNLYYYPIITQHIDNNICSFVGAEKLNYKNKIMKDCLTPYKISSNVNLLYLYSYPKIFQRKETHPDNFFEFDFASKLTPQINFHFKKETNINKIEIIGYAEPDRMPKNILIKTSKNENCEDLTLNKNFFKENDFTLSENLNIEVNISDIKCLSLTFLKTKNKRLLRIYGIKI